MKLGHETVTKYALSNTHTWAWGPIRGGDDQTSKLPSELPQTQASFGERDCPCAKAAPVFLAQPQQISGN